MNTALANKNWDPPTWAAWNAPEEAPGEDSLDALSLPCNSAIAAAGLASEEMEGPVGGEPGSDEDDAGDDVVASVADVAPGADEALSAAAAAAAQAGTALQAGDLRGALAGADRVTQAVARARLLRHAGRAGCAGAALRPPGELRGLVAAHLAAYPTKDFGPHAIGRVLGRCSGAVANALDRLTARATHS